MNFEARSNTIKGVFTSSRVYKIPRFQRDFSWDKKNYNEFLNDMISQIDFKGGGFKTSQYYLGNMLFLGEINGDSVEVIDGQQRLTTITILFAAIRDALYELGTNDSKNFGDTIQKEYLIKNIDGKACRKLETQTSYPYFTQTIQDYETKNNKVKPSTDEEELIETTFKDFKNTLSKIKIIPYIKKAFDIEIEDEKYIYILKAIRDQILNSEIIEIYVKDRDQANKIFENINSKGKLLTQVDLVKNSIFQKIEPTKAGVDEIQSIWLGFNKKIRNIDTDFDEFFFHYWRARYPKDRATAKSLYAKYLKRYGEASYEDIKFLVEDLSISLDIYIEIISPDENNYIKQQKKPELDFLKSISKFRGVQTRVILLAFYKKFKNFENNKKKLRHDKKENLLKFLSDFHFAFFGLKLKNRANLLSTPYNKFVEELDKALTQDDIYKAIESLKYKLISLLNKKQFKDGFIELKFSKKEENYSFASQYAIKRISNELENKPFNDSFYSIEHILDEEYNAKHCDIGNLTVLETKINADINEYKQKNNTKLKYSDKIDYYKKSKYEMVKKLIKEYPNFSKEDIDNRNKKLADFFWENFLQKKE